MVSDYFFKYTNDFGSEIEIFPISARLVINKDTKANSIEIVLASNIFIDGGELIFRPGEFLSIWASNDDLINRSNPLDEDLIGTFKILQISAVEKDGTVKLTGSDITYDLLSNLYTRSVNGTSPNIIENIIQTINSGGISQVSVSTNIQTLRSDGSAFPSKDFTSVYKTAFSCISELSQTSFTGDKLPYIFYFSPSGVFHWKYPSKTPSILKIEYGEEPVIEFNHGRDEAVSINFLIYDCGADKDGASILDFEIKQDAGTIKGKTSFEPMTDIARDLKAFFQANGTYDTMTNDDFRIECLKMGKARAQSIISKVGRGLRSATVLVRGDKYIVTDFYEVQSKTLPLQGLRIEQIIHTFDRTGWKTSLIFKEDQSEVEIV